MRRTAGSISLVATISMLCFQQVSAAQNQSRKGHVVIPESSVEHAGDSGIMAHTHLRIMMPAGGVFTGAPKPNELPPFAGFFFETPASIACIYRLAPHPKAGCNPNETTANPTGGSGAIAVVDAFDTPNAAPDLAAFSAQFGLPPAVFQVVYASGTQPGLDPSGGWELESSLDIEWSHAMAPNARIFLVEANTNSFSDLFQAVAVASNLVATNGGGEVSMSWGGGEFLQETLFDASFTTPGVVYIASSGDSPGAGDFRGTPDFSFDANPNTGVWVLDTNLFEGKRHKWFVLGGTSVSAPSLAGIINSAGRFAASSQAENSFIYGHMFSERGDFRDIIFGNCGLNIGNFARLGWDFCTGVGSDFGLAGK